MTWRVLISLAKILLASLLVGIALSTLNISPERILKDFGMTPEQILDFLRRGVRWALPHVILGACVVVPVCLVVYLLRPPGDE